MLNVFALSALLGATLCLRFRVLILVPIVALFVVLAFGLWSLAPVIAAGGVQIGYLAGTMIVAALLGQPAVNHPARNDLHRCEEPLESTHRTTETRPCDESKS